MSKVTFDDIIYSSAGTYTYTIRERAGNRDDVEYDTHTETVTVYVSDNHDGTLTCVASYDTNGPVFTNSIIPTFDDPDKLGELRIGKEVLNSSGGTFDFQINLTDESGTELTDGFLTDVVRTEGKGHYYTAEHVNYSAVSHTQNLDDEGNKINNSNYGNSWTNQHIRGTGRETALQRTFSMPLPVP